LEVLGRPDLLPLRKHLDETIRAGTDEARSDLSLSLEGGLATLSVQVSALRGSQDERLGTLVMIEDLSDLVRAQRTAAWREVARRIAHEIKNPLTPIQLSAQRLRKRFEAGADDLGSVLPEATAVIEREVAGLKHLVDEFSRYARMPEVRPKEIEIRDVIDSVLALYQGIPGIRWSIDVREQLGPVRLDPDQIRRALINLVDNSVAAMDGKGEITIVVRRSGGHIRIEFADDGPGIGARDRDKLFVPYFSTKQSGTGLGLAIVHRVVTDHRGTIRVEDNRPRGARFIMEIPA
jgi:two-component system nitrogen regulation sensor histidine kinase NtrY